MRIELRDLEKCYIATARERSVRGYPRDTDPAAKVVETDSTALSLSPSRAMNFPRCDVRERLVYLPSANSSVIATLVHTADREPYPAPPLFPIGFRPKSSLIPYAIRCRVFLYL